MEIKSFDSFIDREKGVPCLIAGNAPTIKNFPYTKFKGLYFMVNYGPQLLSRLAKPDYWLSQNYYFPTPQLHWRTINRFKDCVFIFADTAVCPPRQTYDRDLVAARLTVPWFAYDHCHFAHKKCVPENNCCGLVDLHPERRTLQELINHHFHANYTWPVSGTGVTSALAFAVAMGCSPIYLQGVELPIRMKHYLHYHMLFHRYNTILLRAVIKGYIKELLHRDAYTHFYYCMNETLSNFESLVDLCHRRGIEIYNLSPTSNLNKIKSLPYRDHTEVCI